MSVDATRESDGTIEKMSYEEACATTRHHVEITYSRGRLHELHDTLKRILSKGYFPESVIPMQGNGARVYGFMIISHATSPNLDELKPIDAEVVVVPVFGSYLALSSVLPQVFSDWNTYGVDFRILGGSWDSKDTIFSMFFLVSENIQLAQEPILR